MNLYHIQFDGDSWWVEASSLDVAIAAWRQHYFEGEDRDEEPECVVVHRGGVIRPAEKPPVAVSVELTTDVSDDRHAVAVALDEDLLRDAHAALSRRKHETPFRIQVCERLCRRLGIDLPDSPAGVATT